MMPADSSPSNVTSAVKWKRYFKVAVGCALVMLLTIPPHGGFMLIFVVIPLVIWALLSIFAAIRKPEQLKPRAIIFGFWLATILIVLSAHWYYAVDARRAGDGYARIIERYKTAHGVYPPDMKAAGLVPKRNSYMLGYVMRDNGKPFLVYAATFTVFQTYDYDFEHHTWVFQTD